MGGGSAGHVAPVLAVIDELTASQPRLEVRFWCDRGFFVQSQSLMQHASTPVKVEKIRSGKFRRYHGASFFEKLTDIPTIFFNFVDMFTIIIGFFQSLAKLIIWRPRVVFCKGGFVCLPVGLAARLLGIPIVLHDSDTHPGLTNRLLAPHAKAIGTGSPLKYYRYPATKARYVGIPVKPEFHRYRPDQKTQHKALFEVDPAKPLVVVIGGGLGAKRINDAIVAIAPELIAKASVIHISGTRQYDELTTKVPKSADYKLFSFLSDRLAQLISAADVVVTRAGASAMAELAAVGASVIIVPNGQLTGGHQLKNAKVYVDANAAVMSDENIFKDSPELLLQQIFELLDDSDKRHQLSQSLQAFAKPDAASDMAVMIEQAGKI